MTRKKVLMLTQNFYPAIGSAGNRMKNIFQLLLSHDIDIEVLTIEPSYPNKNMYKDRMFWDDEEVNQLSNRITRIPIKSRKFTNRLVSRLFFYLEIMYRFLIEVWKRRKDNIDYIYVSTPPIFIVLSALFGKTIIKNKLILEVRDLWPDSLTGVRAFDNKMIIGLFRFLEKRMYAKADKIVINSVGFKSHIESKLKASTPIIYVPNGPREKEITVSEDKRDGFRVIYAGNLGMAQDIDRLKELASLLNKHEIHFDVLGYGMKKNEFQDYIQNENLTYVNLHEPTTREKSLQLIKNSHVSIAFLNDEEVFSTVLPGKVIDYMTCQTPIVAGVKGVAANIIHQHQTGYAIETTELAPIVEKVLELRDNPELLANMKKNCLKVIQTEFLWEHNIEKIVDIMK